jgi:hypothetical protein
MKPSRLLPALLIATCCLPAAAEDAPRTGLYLGAGGGLHWIDGTGTWGADPFRAAETVPTEEGETIGLAWSDNFLIGVTPLVGIRLSSLLALEIGCDLNVPKTSTQYYSAYYTSSYYEDRMNVEWKQRSLKVQGVLYPTPNRRLRLSAGLLRTSLVMDVTLFESYQTENYFGDPVATESSEDSSDKISTTGLVFGAGYDFPLANDQSVLFLSAEYTSCMTDGGLLDTDDFLVDVGGFAFTAGIRWFPFHR